jgi:hypothetical protein
MIPLFNLSSTSKPNTTQVQNFINNRSQEIDIAIRSRALAVPVADSAWLPELIQLNAKGAAADCMNAAYPSDSGPGSTALGPQLLREYLARLSEIKRGVGIPVAVPAMESDLAPRSYWTDNPVTVPNVPGVIYPDDYSEDCGEPWFKRSSRW